MYMEDIYGTALVRLSDIDRWYTEFPSVELVHNQCVKRQYNDIHYSLPVRLSLSLFLSLCIHYAGPEKEGKKKGYRE